MALTAFIKPFEAPQRSMKISKSVDWFLYGNGLRHERVKFFLFVRDCELRVKKGSSFLK